MSAGELAVRGTILGAYIALRTLAESEWRARRAAQGRYVPAHRQAWGEINERRHAYSRRLQWLMETYP